MAAAGESAARLMSGRAALCRTLLARQSERPVHWMNLVCGVQAPASAPACTSDRQAAYQCNDDYFPAPPTRVYGFRVTCGKRVHGVRVRLGDTPAVRCTSN